MCSLNRESRCKQRHLAEHRTAPGKEGTNYTLFSSIKNTASLTTTSTREVYRTNLGNGRPHPVLHPQLGDGVFFLPPSIQHRRRRSPREGWAGGACPFRKISLRVVAAGGCGSSRRHRLEFWSGPQPLAVRRTVAGRDGGMARRGEERKGRKKTTNKKTVKYASEAEQEGGG